MNGHYKRMKYFVLTNPICTFEETKNNLIMKKIYLSILAAVTSTAMIAQTNLSFEDWDAGEPVDWFTSLIYDDFGDVSATPVLQMTDVPTDGASYFRGETFEFTNSIDPTNAPNGIYGGYAILDFASTDEYGSLTIDVKYDVQGNDEATVAIFGEDAGGDVIAVGADFFTGTQGTFETVTIPISYFGTDPVAWTIIVSSSAESVLANQPPAELGSILDADNIVLSLSNPAPNVSNVVASDIDDNCDGTDLEVAFDVPGDETDIANYYLLVTTPDISPGMLADPLAAFEAFGVQLTPDGTNKTHVFAAADDYYYVDNGQLAAAPIAEDVELVVHVYVEGQNGFDDVFNVSNPVTLDCPGSGASLFENEIEGANVYPNPATNKVNFDFGNNTVESLTITDMNGRTIETVKGNTSFVTVDVNGLENGVYFYNAVDNAGNIISANKFVVNH